MARPLHEIALYAGAAFFGVAAYRVTRWLRREEKPDDYLSHVRVGVVPDPDNPVYWPEFVPDLEQMVN